MAFGRREASVVRTKAFRTQTLVETLKMTEFGFITFAFQLLNFPPVASDEPPDLLPPTGSAERKTAERVKAER